MDGFPQYFDIILFAMIAGFLILRLRSVLGRRTGNERHRDPFARRAEAVTDKVVTLPHRQDAAAAPPLTIDVEDAVAGGLARIEAGDPSFDPPRFLEGARVAFGMIVSAFAKGDKAQLRPLLSDEVFEPFAAAIDAREAAHETHETRIIGIKKFDIAGATLEGSAARVTVNVVSDQINATRASDGTVVDGDPDHPIEKTDFWTFARDIGSANPNWLLVATGSD